MLHALGRLTATTARRIRRAVEDAGRRREALAVLLLVALPLVLLAANRSWIWDNPDFNDTSIYVGFFRRYLEFKLPFTANYKSSRLPWVLPGVALYRLLPAAVAHHVLYLTFLIGEALLIFAFARRRFGVQVAFVVAAAAVTSTFTHERTSYHNQAAATYFVAALVLLERPARWPWFVRMALAGGALALDITTDTVAAAFGPMFAVFAYVAVPRPRGLLRLLAAGGALLGGAMLALAAVGAVNVLLGGPFAFFMEQVRYSLAVVNAKTLSYRTLLEILGDLPLYPYLVFPVLVSVGAVFVLGVQAVRRRFDAAGLGAVGVLVSMGAIVLMQVRGLGALEYDTLFQPFYAPVYLALGGMLGGVRRAAPVRAWFLLAVAALFVAPLSLFGRRLYLMTTTGDLLSGFKLALLMAGITTSAILAWRRRATPRLIVVAAALGLMNAVCTSGSQPAYAYQAGATCPFRGETFDALLEADDAFEAWDPEHTARFGSEAPRLSVPVFDGRSWCKNLPLGLVSNAVLLPRYFYTSAELARGWPDAGPLNKIALAATSPEGMEGVRQAFAKLLRPDQRLETRVSRIFVHETFALYLVGVEAVPR